MKLCCNLVLLIVVSALFAPELARAAETDAVGLDFFEKKIRPVLVANCYQCHSASSKEVKGNLRVDIKQGIRKGGDTGPSVVPGKPGDSLLIQALRHEDGLEMPPKQKLSEEVIADFTKWVQLGAPDPRESSASTVGKKISLAEARKFWSLQPPKVTAPAAALNASWARTPIDRYVIAGLEANKLTPVADADKSVLIRRLYFDLLGLPPTPEEVDVFVADQSPKATEALVDLLLASPQFGERWGRHWLDVARFGESTGKERNVPYNYAWRYRDYVIDAFAKDKPYDQFIREQIAGDLLPASTPAEKNEHITATGFLTLSPRSLNERNVEQFAMDIADEQIDVTTRAFMGISVACARCHDHKFDPIQQQDYYALAGIFRSTEVFAGVKRGNNKTGYEGDYVSLVSTTKSAGSEADRRELARLEREIAQAKVDLARAKQALGDISPAVVKAALKAKNKNKADKANKRNKAAIANPFQKEERRLKELVATRDDLEKKVSPPGESAMGVREASKLMDCRINIRGEVNDLGDEVNRGLVRVLMFPGAPQIDKTQSGRLQLAAWITNRNNPLTARVMANRVWFHLFGRGLVETVDNFGALGETPSHPELLDYLAIRLMDQKWSTKQLIREVVLSRTYQLASTHQATNYNSDPENKYLWRMSRRRLEAEAIRDAVLASSGKLNLERPVGSAVMKLGGGELGRQVKGDELLKENHHRSCYLPMARGYVPEFLNVFDMADPELVTGQRDVTTVATQALYLMNSPVVHDLSESTAQRLLNDPRFVDSNARVDYAFRLIVGHRPTVDQIGEVQQFLKDFASTQAAGMSPDQRRLQGWTALCHTLYASAEFRYVY
ncbi:PSD1 and planctomycete cytochrome C domain-containing protein [Anatilimnocola sp. NA78]|uniref:PSD1 and planctomycete cytochrome C domain-containing protein n=1 Tax=Anatilimnocola sp. NA78 TaxID=3415683 RepID=UPI003CE55DBD